MIQMNKYQTPITEELLNSLPEEVQEQLLECVRTIPFIKNLIAVDRPYYTDLKRDENNRAIVDITNPPIMTDMDYFRQPAIHYLKHGVYSFLKPNKNPNSEFRKFWDEERRRCWDGLLRESDGAWISGLNYWFLNYQPMMVNMIEPGKKKAIRTESFPFPMEGIDYRFNYLNRAREDGKHAIELAKRGCAKSYSLSSIMGRNLILGESYLSRKRVVTVLTAYQKEYLKDDKDGTLAKFRPAINHVFKSTPFPRLLSKQSPGDMSWQMGYTDSLTGIEKGSFNQVMAVSAKDDSGKLRGKRGWILYEEMGNFKDLLSLYDITRKSVEDGDYTFACQYLVGTASENESDFSSAKILLYNPEAYNILSVPNVYDKPKQGKDTFGYFFPSYLNRAGCYNKDGVSDVIKALIEILTARYKAKYGANPQSILRVIAEDPITPAEAIIKVKSAYFPVVAATERVGQLDKNPNSFDEVHIGELVQDGAEVKFKPTNATPIRTFGVENSTEGALEIYSMPKKDTNGKVFNDRYIVSHDPVDNDSADSSSLSSTFVLDLWTDSIAAEYTGRKAFANDNYEVVRLLCLFFNGKCLYESNKKGIYAYFSQMNCTHLLADTPEYLRDKQLVKYSGFGSNQKGVNASAALNAYANSLVKDWLCKPVTVLIEEDGEEKEITIMKIYELKCRALLEEIIAFSPEINVDRIRSLGMLMLYREEKMVLYGGNPGKNANKTPKDYLGNDDFFNRNYKRKSKPRQRY